ncbi:MAG TPA: hypothetical protein PK014_03840 [Thermoanaerobaculia bacterium]|nr:hypothetical protein [Thermoanaerobaculia bacterium]HUM29092.1 hypothetical protein [Thermoanaerobaculia bacterium]HXK67469.1 hypothetical protein [Thermoanaerobaculia bacterium]
MKAWMVLVIALIILGLFGALWVVEERKVDKVKDDLDAARTDFSQKLQAKDAEMAKMERSHKSDLARSMAVFAKDLLATRDQGALITAVNDAITTLPVDEIVIVDSTGLVIATSNLKFSDLTLTDAGFAKALEADGPIYADGAWYAAAGKGALAPGMVRVK